MNMPPCPRCGASVQPDWDWCHECGYDPDGLRPPAASAAPGVPDDRSSPRPTSAGTPTLTKPASRPHTSTSAAAASAESEGEGGTRLLIALSVATAVVVALFVVVLVTRDDDASAPSVAFPDDWVAFMSADGIVSAEFPQVPIEEQQGLAIEGNSAVDVQMYLDETEYWSFVIMVSDAGAAVPVDLAQVVGGMALDLGGEVVAQTPSEFQGSGAIDVTIEAGERTVYGTATIIGGRIVVIEQGSVQSDPEIFSRFRSSVVINAS